MEGNKLLIVGGILLALAIVAFIGQYLSSERFTVTQYAKDNNLRNCGYESDSYNKEVRECILDALKTCTPAYAKTHSDGVAWEASGYTKSVEVKTNPQGGCGIQYRADHTTSFGAYSFDSFCKAVQLVGEQQRHLQVSDCKNIEKPQLF